MPGTYIWLVLLLSGFAMWRLARESLPDSQAMAAALIFVVNPYQLVVVYYRSDYAELLASSLFPFMVLGALRVVRPEPKPSDSRQSLDRRAAPCARICGDMAFERARRSDRDILIGSAASRRLS